MNDESTRVVSRVPSEMREYLAFGDRVRFQLTGAETQGRYCVFELEAPPGGGPPPHLHEREDEWFVVLEGRAEFLKNGEWVEVPVGSAVFAPRGSVHSFRNVGNTVLRLHIQTSPAGFEEFFEAMAEEFAKEGGPDMAKVIELSNRFGISYPDPGGKAE